VTLGISFSSVGVQTLPGPEAGGLAQKRVSELLSFLLVLGVLLAGRILSIVLSTMFACMVVGL
jgi:hypothetical protein